mgnify:FL=1
MTRSLYKGPYVEPILLKELISSPLNLSDAILTNARDSVITSIYINKSIGVYNGKDYVVIPVKREMVGKKLGEFVPTKKKVVFKKKKRKK